MKNEVNVGDLTPQQRLELARGDKAAPVGDASCEIEAVLASDYAALEAELAKMRAVPGWKLVPVEPTPEMVSAAEEAHMPFGDMDIALRMAMLAAPAPVAEPASPWVAVSERLPKKGEDVQVYCDTSGEQMVAFSLGDGRFQFAVDLHGDAIACRPTHWMPLPKSPEESK